MEELTPITRREVFLAKAAGQNVETPTPVTREEVFLDEIAKGGGSSLPAVTPSDNGKVLGVVNGAWAASEQGKKFIVTLTPTDETGMNGVTDKTGAEIYQAYEEGKEIVFSLPFLGTFAYISFIAYGSSYVQPHAIAVFSPDGTNYMIGDVYTEQAWSDNTHTIDYTVIPFTLTPAG